MALYKVTFEFLNERGEWRRDYLDNNGNGYTLKAATEVAMGITSSQVCDTRNVQIKLVTRNGQAKPGEDAPIRVGKPVYLFGENF